VAPLKSRRNLIERNPAPEPGQGLSREEALDLLSNIDRFPEFCERFLKIIPIGGNEAIPFRFNKIQRWVFDRYIREPYRNGVPVRVICLKMRQSGMSTMMEAFTFWCVLGHPHWNALVVAKQKSQSQTVFRMMKRFYRNLPPGQGLPTFMVNSYNKDMLEFARPDERKFKYDDRGYNWLVDLDSRVEIKSAEEDDMLGRGGTYQTVHATEVSGWPNLASSLGSLLSCCHEQPQTCVFLESTANGMNDFYDFWMNETAENKPIPSMWRLVFIPWFWDDRYEIKWGEHKREFIDDYEEGLYRRIITDKTLQEIDPGLTEDRVWNKLYWRRSAIWNKLKGDVDLFNQEFPSTPDEAFRFSGTSVFNARSMSKMQEDIREPEWRGEIEVDADTATLHSGRIDVPYKRVNHERGKLKVWQEPQQFARYVVSVDVAEGKASEGVSEEFSKYDFSVIQVLCITSFPPLEQVACWHGNIDPYRLGYLAVAVAQIYNEALLSWEVNGIGIALKAPIMEHLHYRRLYLREDWDSVTREKQMKPGWKTSSRTKPLMVGTGIMFVHQQQVVVHDAATLSEMKVFSRVDENKFEAARGHDDRVMALLQGLAIIESRIELAKRKSAEEKRISKAPDKGLYVDKWPWETDSVGQNPILGKDF
jgi:hypothetical protein